MTTWNDVKNYIHNNYKADDVQDTLLQLVFQIDGLRSQLVFVGYDRTESGIEWVKVHSPIGLVADLDIARTASLLSEKVAGGLVIIGEKAFVTNAVPLANLDANELVEPMSLVLNVADQLEAQLLGVDTH